MKRHGIILPGKSDRGQVGLVLLAVYPDLLPPGARQHKDLAPAEAGQADRSHWVAMICHNSLQAVGQQAPDLDLSIILELRIVPCNLVLLPLVISNHVSHLRTTPVFSALSYNLVSHF